MVRKIANPPIVPHPSTYSLTLLCISPSLSHSPVYLSFSLSCISPFISLTLLYISPSLSHSLLYISVSLSLASLYLFPSIFSPIEMKHLSPIWILLYTTIRAQISSPFNDIFDNANSSKKCIIFPSSYSLFPHTTNYFSVDTLPFAKVFFMSLSEFY